jgi:hypothetical protein
MKKNLFHLPAGIVFILFCIINFNAAAQTNNCLKNQPVNSKIHTVTYSSGVTYTYTYETPVECGRLLSITTSNNSYSIEFNYALNTATEIIAGTTRIYTLNASGFAISRNSPAATYIVQSLSDDPNATAGYWVVANDASVPDIILHDGGNVINESRSGQNNFSYTYTSDYSGLENYFGLSTKNTNWVRQQTDNTTTPPTVVSTFTYQYDAKHRVKKQFRNGTELISNITYY